MGLKSAIGDIDTVGPQPITEISVKRLGFLRRRCVGKRWPIAFAAIGVKRELGDHQKRTAAIEHGTIHLPLLILEDAQLGDLIGEGGGIFFIIVQAYAQEDAKSWADFTDHFGIDADAGFGDSLNNGAHGGFKLAV
jgi:hypothetical protein